MYGLIGRSLITLHRQVQNCFLEMAPTFLGPAPPTIQVSWLKWFSVVAIRKIISAKEDSKEFVTRIQWHQSHILWLIKQVLHPAWHKALIWFISSQAGGLTGKAAIHECFRRTGCQGPLWQNLQGQKSFWLTFWTNIAYFLELVCLKKLIVLPQFCLTFFYKKVFCGSKKSGEYREKRRNVQISDLTISDIKGLTFSSSSV